MPKNQSIYVFSSWEEFYDSMLESARNLQKTYDAITTHPRKPGHGENYSRDKYFNEFKKIVKQKERVRFRRIVTVTTKSKCKWIENSINEFKNCNNFNLAYFEQFEGYFPLIGIIIFDKKELYLTTVFHPQSDSIYVKVTTSKLINFFYDYFEKLWTFDTSKKIKEGNNIYYDVLDSLKTKVGINLSKQENEDYSFIIEDLESHKKDYYKLGIFQFDFSDYFITKKNLHYPKEGHEKEKLDFIKNILLDEQDLDIIILPELSINAKSKKTLIDYSNDFKVCIIGGSYYNHNRRNVCPIIMPKGKILYTEKQKIPPIESSIIMNEGPLHGEYNTIVINSAYGSFGVLICADFYDTRAQMELSRYDLDFVFIIALNNKSKEYFKIIDAKLINGLREDNKMPFYIYCNSISKYSDGKTSILGLADKNIIPKLRSNDNIKPVNDLYYHLAEIRKEGVLIAKLKSDNSIKGINSINDENIISEIRTIEKNQYSN